MFKSVVKKPVVAVVALVAIAVLVFVFFTQNENLKVGFVYFSAAEDDGWTYQHDQARLALEEELGVETTFVENVPEGPEAEPVISQLAATGHNLIFTTSSGFMDPTLKVANQYEDVMFEHATGYKQAPNLATYSPRFYEGRYVAGYIAGEMTKTNILGYVASFPIPQVIRGINATIRGARLANPDVVIKVVWLSSWLDPVKEADAAKTLIDQGADVILQHTDSPAPLQVAEERGVWAVGQAYDMREFGENAQLTSIINNWTPYYIERTKAAMDGTWSGGGDTWGGLASGMVVIGDYNKAIPANVVAKAEEIRQGIIDGSVHPFAGPVVKQDGSVVVAEGEVADDAMLVGMDFYVEGIEDELPQ